MERTKKKKKVLATVLDPDFAIQIQKIAENKNKTVSMFLESLLKDFTEGRLLRRELPVLNLFEFSCKTSITLTMIAGYSPRSESETVILLTNGNEIILNQSWEQTKQDLTQAGVLLR